MTTGSADTALPANTAPSADRALPGDSADPRTRSIWRTQLILAAAVVVICLLVLTLEPELFSQWTFAVGTGVIIALTLLTLIVPWARVPNGGVLVVPFLDAAAIGLIASADELRFGFLWAFPVMWVSMHFAPAAIGGMLAFTGAMLAVDAALPPGVGFSLTLIIVLITLAFIAITTHLATRQNRTLRRLLSRQAGRLTLTAERRKDQERRSSEILNGVDTGVMRISSSGQVLAVNEAYTRLYGLDPLDPNLPARSIEYRGLRGMPIPAMDRPFARAARGETFTGERVWLFTPEGQWHALSLTTKKLFSSRSEDASLLLIASDITAISYAERERARLAAIASHELKNPLTVLIANAELALDGEELAPPLRARLETMLDAGNRMEEIAGSLLTSSRSAATGRDALDDIDLREIVAESVASFGPTARAHGVTVDADTLDSLPLVGDGFRLRQVIDNLVSNAIKYTLSGGAVTITGTLREDTVQLSVSDTGIGVAEDELPKLLDPYFRTREAQKTASGTGLGLGITRDIVTSHNGTLSIQSELGVGTTVTVTLPRRAEFDLRTEVPA